MELEASTAREKVMLHLRQCIPLPQVIGEQGCFLGPAAWLGQPGLTPGQRPRLCTAQEHRLLSPVSPCQLGQGLAVSPHQLRFHHPRQRRPQHLSLLLCLLLAAVHRAWLDESLCHQGGSPLPHALPGPRQHSCPGYPCWARGPQSTLTGHFPAPPTSSRSWASHDGVPGREKGPSPRGHCSLPPKPPCQCAPPHALGTALLCSSCPHSCLSSWGERYFSCNAMGAQCRVAGHLGTPDPLRP